MSNWEEIANEVAPLGMRSHGLAAGANRKKPLNLKKNSSQELQFVSSPHCETDTPLSEILRGAECVHPAGSFFHITRAAAEFGPQFSDLPVLLGTAVQSISKNADARQLLFLDIETTGLSPRGPLFLIGALHSGNGQGAVLEQFFARVLDEEQAAISAFFEIVAGKTLVTFNGKRFDWPFIMARAERYSVTVPEIGGHFDLLHYARRHWKMQVPNCRLQTLEQYLCNRGRKGDIPSSKIPDQYEHFAEFYAHSERGAHLITPIIHHNIWDVLTMADLLRRCQ